MTTFGPAYSRALDGRRINRQMTAILTLMRDGTWRTLNEIQVATGFPQASISADLRHFRKPQFGGLVVEKRRRSLGELGTWEYRVLAPLPADPDGQQRLVT